jgi:CBS domain-containing protein
MKIEEIMSKNPVCCTPQTSLVEVAQMMVEFDCGAIPVVDNPQTMGPVVGVVTDRDIVCRTLAKGRNPLEMAAQDCMSAPVLAVRPDDSIDDARRIMEEYQIRRLPVINQDQVLVGFTTQAQIARNSTNDQSGELLKSVTRSSGSPSRIPNVRSSGS